MDKNKSLRKSKTLLLNPRFQFTFLGFMAGMAALVIMTTYCANLYFFWKFRQMGIGMHLGADHIFFQFLNRQQSIMNLVFSVASVTVFILLTTFGVVFSHRIAGPLYKLHKHFRETAKTGKYTPVAFRQGDFFREIADAYNEQLRGRSKKS